MFVFLVLSLTLYVLGIFSRKSNNEESNQDNPTNRKSSGIYPFEKLPKTIYSMEKCLWKDNQNGKTFKFSVMIKQTNKQTKTLSKHQIKMYFPSEKKLRIFFSLNSHQTNKQTNKWKKQAKP